MYINSGVSLGLELSRVIWLESSHFYKSVVKVTRSVMSELKMRSTSGQTDQILVKIFWLGYLVENTHTHTHTPTHTHKNKQKNKNNNNNNNKQNKTKQKTNKNKSKTKQKPIGMSKSVVKPVIT